MTTGRGGSFYDAPGVHARYTGHHDESRFSPNHVMEEPAVLAELGDPAGLHVLDLGCGDGRFGRKLLDAGCAGYLGIDGSRAMVEHARATLAGTTGRVAHGNLEDFAAAPGSVDVITARLSLHYVDDVAVVLAAAARALRPCGRFLMTVVHPVITSHDTRSSRPRTTWTVDDYFHSGPRTRAWFGRPVTWYHRTVEQYVDAVTASGLTLTALRECQPVADRFDGDTEEWARRMRVPLFLLLSATTDPAARPTTRR
jgi:SAM-dependent methyltransferase